MILVGLWGRCDEADEFVAGRFVSTKYDENPPPWGCFGGWKSVSIGIGEDERFGGTGKSGTETREVAYGSRSLELAAPTRRLVERRGF